MARYGGRCTLVEKLGQAARPEGSPVSNVTYSQITYVKSMLSKLQHCDIIICMIEFPLKHTAAISFKFKFKIRFT